GPDRKAESTRRSHRQSKPARGRAPDSRLQDRTQEKWRPAKTSRDIVAPARELRTRQKPPARTSTKGRRRTSTARRRIFRQRKQLSARVAQITVATLLALPERCPHPREARRVKRNKSRFEHETPRSRFRPRRKSPQRFHPSNQAR